MADNKTNINIDGANVNITSISSEVLSQLSAFLGDDSNGNIKQIMQLKDSNRQDVESIEKQIEKQRKELEFLREEEKNALNDYKTASDSAQRHEAGAYLNAVKERMGVAKLNLSILNEQRKETEKITKQVEHQTESIKQQTKEIEERNKKIRDGYKDAREFEQKHRLIAQTTIGKHITEHMRLGNSKPKLQGVISGGISALGKGSSNIANFLGSDQQQTISGVGGQIANIAGMFGPWGKAAGAAVQAVTAIVEQYDKINKASSDYARSVGGGAAKMQVMKTDATQVAYSISKWGGLAYKFDKILQHISELSEKTGRVMDHMSEMDIKSLEDLTRHGITSDVLNQYDTFGLSMERIDERVTRIYKTSGKHGLNAKAVTDTVNKNLKMAQQYTFAGGQRALERMAEKAVALKYNMESVARFADKVSTLEGATQTAAGLSVLGGDFSRMANPLSLLYGGLQDPERLNEMMLNMTKNMAHWDSRTKEYRVTGENRFRLRQAAEYMGVSVEDLLNQSYTQAKRRDIDKVLDKKGINDEDTREYIRNLAHMDENGRAYIRFSGEKQKTYLDKMDTVDKERLKKESDAMEQKDKAKIGDIYMETRTISETLNDYVGWFKGGFFNVLQRWFGSSNENTALSKGLNAKNAEAYEDLLKSYSKGNGAGNKTLSILEKLGLGKDSDIYKKIKGGEFTRDEYSEKLLDILLEAQKSGIQYKGNPWYHGSGAHKRSFEEGWEKINREEVNKKAYGGIIRGKGTSKSDSIPAWLSNGEFVVNASATSKHLPELQAMNAEGFSRGTITPIRAGKNQYNLGTSVLPPMSMSNVGVGGVQHVTIDPLQVSGTLTLNVAGGGSKTINANELFTQENVNILLRKLQESLGFRLDKTEFRMPKFI